MFGALPRAANAATNIYVPDHYPTIQAAVDAASPSDTIIVRDGTYHESVLVDKSLTLKGEGTPVVSGVTHSVITVTADACTIDGFEITGGGCGGNDAGIEVRSDYNLIKGNIVRNNYGGMALYHCSHNTLISNLIYENHWYGIGLCSSSCSNTLSNNTVRDNTNIGIKLYYSSNTNIVSGNTVSGSNVFGIELWESSFNTLYQNNLIDNARNARDCYGDNSWDNGSKGNYWSDYTGVDANGDGIGDTPYELTPDHGGCGGKDKYPLMEPFARTWYVDDDKQDYPDADFIKIQDAVDAASAGDTIIVYPGTYTENVDVNKSLTIQSESGAEATIVQAANPDDHVFEVSADYVSIDGFATKGIAWKEHHFPAGICLRNVEHCSITNNAVNPNNSLGIDLYYSNNNMVMNNIVSSNGYGRGIYLNYSNNNTITNNIALTNGYGIQLVLSNNNTITNNTANSNTKDGYGICLSNSDNNAIANNTTNANKCDGIYLYCSNNNMITKNIASNNSGGIDLYYSNNNNFIYLNNLVDNSFHNGYAEDSTNTWNSPEQIIYTYNGKTYASHLGNHWSDYAGSDADGDGIGDTAYSINSDSDNYPLVEPFQNYVITPEGLQIGDIVATTVYLYVRHISDWSDPLDPNNLIFTMHPPSDRAKPPHDVGKIVDGPETDTAYGYTWWKIEWDNGEVGWSAEESLEEPTEKWLVKSDKPFLKIQDLEDPFNYQADYGLDEGDLKQNEADALPIVMKYASKYHISPALIMAIIRQESDFDPTAKGDYWDGEFHSFGYMQVSYGAATDTYKGYTGDEYKGTTEQWKTDGLDPETNIKYGTRYLRIQHDRIEDACSGYEDVYDGILRSTVSAYNAGHPTLNNRMCYVLGGTCNGVYTGVIEGKLVDAEHRGYKFFLSNRVPSPKPVITSPLVITPQDTHCIGDTLTAEFSITSRRTESVTFDVLVVGGRDPCGEVVDFDKAHNITLDPGDTYDYEGNLTLPDKPGIYHFFCAYHTEEYLPGEDENNWNTNIEVEIDGEIIQDFTEAKRYRERDIVVFEESYISPPPPPVLWEKIDGPWDSWPKSLGNWNEPPVIAVNPNNPKEIYVEAIHRTENWWEDEGGKLYRSTDGGGSWEPINEGLPGLHWSEYYWPIRAIAIAPSNPDIIYVGTSDFDPYSSGLGNGVYKSTNGGSEWIPVGGPETGRWPFKNYVGVSSMAVNPIDADIVYVGTIGEGIWKSNTKNGEETWEKIWGPPFAPPQYVSTEVNALVISPADPNIIYATAYEFGRLGGHWTGTFRHYLLRSQQGGDKDTWESILSEEIEEMDKVDDITVDNKDANTVYIMTNNYAIYNSTNAGKKWDDASGTDGANALPSRPPTGGPLLGRYGKCASISMHHEFSNVIYAAGEWELGSVYFSGDSGIDWFPFGDPPLKDGVKELAFASDANSHVLYAAATHGLYKCNISESVIVAREHSPAELRVYDSQRRVTGLVNGEIKNEMPNSIYHQESNTVTILFATDYYQYQTVGTDEGSYGLDVVSIEAGEATTFAAIDIPTVSGAIHQYGIDWDALSQGEAGVTIQIDSDGDGEFEEIILTTPPNIPSNPSPSNHATGVPINAALSWMGGDPDEEDSVTYNVYFGADENPPLVSEGQTSNLHYPASNYGTKYYWKVLARDNHGVASVGPMWDFTTGLAGDANGDGNINVLDMTKVARIILLLDSQTPGADANEDGSINVLDMTKIARIILLLD